MADRVNNGGPAFPGKYFDRHLFAEARETEGVIAAKTVATVKAPGMSLRDYFAAKAMAAIITLSASPDFQSVSGEPMTERMFADQAYHFADAMLKAREVQP